MYERDKESRVGINNTTDAVDVTESRELLGEEIIYSAFSVYTFHLACTNRDTLRPNGIDKRLDKRKLSFVEKKLFNHDDGLFNDDAGHVR